MNIEDIQKDWRVLDKEEFHIPENVRLISHEKFSPRAGIDVEYIAPGSLAKIMKFSSILFNFFYAFQLLWKCDTNSVIILNGSGKLWFFVGLLNRLFYRKRSILCWDIFVEVNKPWKRKTMKRALQGVSLSVVWSKAQVSTHALFLEMPEERFLYLPYKANHSQGPRYDIPIENYIFSGGNGKRDYACLVNAVRGTNIPVIISATDPKVRKNIELIPNVIVLAASEPAFAKLQAASRFIVVPMIYTGLKGGGEANFCNGMWHGKPVIASDSIAASDYIINGETGYIVPSGDSNALRKRIQELWNDQEKTITMGKAARIHADKNFTHDKFISRLFKVALILGYLKIS